VNGLELRASDADREQAVLVLREHAAQGRLTLEEFTQRMSAAYDARTTTELEELARDLPVATAPSRRSPTRLLLGILGSTERTGRLRVRRRVFCGVLFGNVDLDLRQATLERNVITVFTFGLFGTADVYVPEGVEVDLHSVAIFGHQRARGDDAPPHPGTPLVRVFGLSLFCGIDVWRVPREWASRTFREVIRGIRKGDHRKELTQ
jgi:hypothetical protein